MKHDTVRWRRYLRIFGADPAADVQDELRFHLASKVDELAAQGWGRPEAHEEALRQFGDFHAVEVEGIKLGMERERSQRRADWFGAWRQDVRYALRTLIRDRGFAASTVLILALGIAANTAVFSVVNTVLLRPLPFPEAARLTWFTGGKNLPPDIVKAAGLGAVTFNVSAYEEFRRHNESFESVTSYNAFLGSSEYTLTERGEPRAAAGVIVADNFFRTLGVAPQQGRFFSKQECEKGGPLAVVLSDAFWRQQFGADRAIVGQSITLSKKPYTVVGILPAGFDFGSFFAPVVKIDVYVPAVMDQLRNWGNTLAMVGRLKPAVAVARAQAEADLLFPRLKAANKDWEIDYSPTIGSLKDFVSGKLRRSLVMLWWAVGLILLLVCVNVSNLLLARAIARSKEFALRIALGAGRGRLFRQLLTESFVLAAAGSLLGLALAFCAVSYLAHQNAVALPMIHLVKVDAASLAWTLLITIVATLLFGCIAGLKLINDRVQESLKDGGQGMSAGRKHETLRTGMVVSEVALACVLLIGAGLLLRSFLAVLNADLGFEPSRAAVMKIDYEGGDSRAKRGAVLQELLNKIRAIPGIEAAGVADMLPLGRNRSWPFLLNGKTYPPGIPGDVALVRIVTPGYLAAIGMRLQMGRDFTWADSTTNTPVMIVNQAAARRFWPGLDPLAQTCRQDDQKMATRVIGVVANVRQNSVETLPEPEVYLSAAQSDPEGAELVIRSSRPPQSLAGDVMRTLRSLNPAQPATELYPLGDLVDHSTSPRRFFAVLVGSFAVLGLVLASLGIYGVMSYAVTRQTQEIGIRMALGSTVSQVRGAVLRRALRLTVTGVTVGLLASFVVSRWISSLLFATKEDDPLTFAITIFALVLVAMAAAYIPARRASRIDPILALRAR